MDIDTRLDELGRELVLVLRRIAIAHERRAEAERELLAATAYRVRLEEEIIGVSGGRLYGEPSAGRLPSLPTGERTTVIRPESILGLDDSSWRS